ncbi:MAG: histidinol-phosphate transaminase [Kineosporiaceae bacterium]|nr:histidinol-phosphate transaminase [Kineosporiaceae bacterium]
MTLPLREDLRGKTAYGAPQLEVAVRLNTNENSYPVPPGVVASIVAAVSEQAPALNRYPDREFTALREALAGYLAPAAGRRIEASEIWAGNGSNEVLQHIFQAFGGPGRPALGFTPAYSMHPIIASVTATPWIDGVRGVETTSGERSFDLDAAQAVDQVRAHDPALVFLVSPNNPTGTALDLEVVRAVLEEARTRSCMVVVDEAYAEFARRGTPSALTLLTDAAGADRLIVSRTMSKAFALAGARVGYLAARPEVGEALRLVRLPYHLSALTQAAAVAALGHAEELLSTVEAIKAQRDRIVQVLPTLGLSPVPSDANFVLFGGLPDEKVAWQGLLARGVLIRDVGIRHHLRVTAGTASETAAFLDAMAEVVGMAGMAEVAGQPQPSTDAGPSMRAAARSGT